MRREFYPAVQAGVAWFTPVSDVRPAATAREDRAMTCLLNLILDVPNKVLDVILGPEEQIAYVSVTTRR